MMLFSGAIRSCLAQSVRKVQRMRFLSTKTAQAVDMSILAKNLPTPPKFANVAEERLYRKQVLAGSFRLFAQFGFDEGAAGHITVRDPEHPDTFWVNPFGVHFSMVKVSNLIRCDEEGNVVEGVYPVNRAAFAIHSRVHRHRPDVLAAAHSHSLYGKAWSVFGRKLDAITQDACAFYQDHSIYDDYGGVAIELDEGQRIANALDKNKAVILKNHGLLTVGIQSLEECVWWFISMERCCQVQLLTHQANLPITTINEEAAKQAYSIVGSSFAGWFQFQMLFEKIKKEQPDFLL